MLRALTASMIAQMRLPILAMISAIAAWGCFVGAANALEAVDEPVTIPGERTIAQDEPAAGESVGEPSAEDAPVEGEPSAGEAPNIPADDQPADDADSSAPDAAPSEDPPAD